MSNGGGGGNYLVAVAVCLLRQEDVVDRDDVVVELDLDTIYVCKLLKEEEVLGLIEELVTQHKNWKT